MDTLGTGASAAAVLDLVLLTKDFYFSVKCRTVSVNVVKFQ